MAYAVYLAAVDPEEVESLRAGATTGLRTREVIGVTDLVTYWIKEKPLGVIVHEIVDEGAPLGDAFWHPRRPPNVQTPEDVRSLENRLRQAWQELPEETRHAHLFSKEMGQILSLLASAVREGSALVSALEPPAGEIAKVRCPFDASAQLPFPWGDLT